MWRNSKWAVAVNAVGRWWLTPGSLRVDRALFRRLTLNTMNHFKLCFQFQLTPLLRGHLRVPVVRAPPGGD